MKKKGVLGIFAVLLVLALVLAGCPNDTETVIRGESETADVVVVGAGIAGLAAAIELKTEKPELKIMLLEKQYRTGGSLWTSSGYIGTSAKSTNAFNTNTTDDVVEFLNHWIGADKINETFVRKLYDLAPYVTNNFIDWGIDFERIDTPSPVPAGTPANRVKARDPHQERGIFGRNPNIQLWYYGPAGTAETTANGTRHIANVQYSKSQEMGIDVRLNSKVTELIDINNRTIIGVKVDGETKSYNVYAKAVVLATGGFSSNGELVKELTGDMYKNIPTSANPYSSNPGATGDVFALVKKLGVPLIGEGVMAYAGAAVNPPQGTTFNSRFYINKDGERYMDEYSWGYGITYGSKDEEGGAWRLMSTDDTAAKTALDAIDTTPNSDRFISAVDLNELGTKMGVANSGTFATALATTISDYNAAVAGASASDTVLTVNNQPTVWKATATPVNTTAGYKYYAQRITFSTAGSLVSIRTDNDTRVVNSNYGGAGTSTATQRIPGLYAAGECAISNQFWGGLYAGSGFGVGSSAYNGVLAARTIIADHFTPAP